MDGQGRESIRGGEIAHWMFLKLETNFRQQEIVTLSSKGLISWIHKSSNYAHLYGY